MVEERRDDWHRGVDENLASLNAGMRVWDRELEKIHKGIAGIDDLLRGDAEKDTDGLLQRTHAAETEIRFLRAVVLDDPSGHIGLQGRVEKLENREKTEVERWKFRAAVLGLLGAVVIAVVTNLDKIERFIGRNQKPDPVQEAIERAKRPRGRKLYRVRVVPGQAAPEDPQDDPPERPPLP